MEACQLQRQEKHDEIIESWQECKDKNGRHFFVNFKTNTTAWERPEPDYFEDELPFEYFLKVLKLSDLLR